jgi:cytochrome c
MSFFEINKIVGAVLATALIASVISIAGNVLVPEGGGEGESGEKKAAATAAAKKPAKAAAATTPKPPETPLANLLAQGSAEAGQKVAKKCAACHSVNKGGANKIGPNLYGIVGRAKGSYPGYTYSAAMKGAGGTWTFADLNAFLKKTTAFVKGTKMRFRISKPVSRANLLLYLRTLSDSPAPLPKPVPAPSGGGTGKKAEAAQKTTAEKKPAEAPKPPEPTNKSAAPSAAAALAAGDAARGAKLAKRKCMVCHSVTKGGPNKIGPNLYGIVGRVRASYEGYRYSKAMKAKGGTWSAADIFTFLAGPQKFVKGTNMPVKVRNPAQRADIIAYLRTLGGK